MAIYPRAVSKRYPVKSAKRLTKKVRYLKPRPYAPKSIVQGFTMRDGVFGFPPVIRTKLRYVEDIALSSASGATTGNVFRANGLFDPNETGTGHQPMFFDTFKAVYGRYVVRASRIKVTFNPVTETAATSLFTVGIMGKNNGTIESAPSANCEQPYSVWAQCNGRNGSSGQQILYMSYDPLKHLGRSWTDDDVGAAIGADPNVQFKFVAWCADLQATGTTNLVASVEIIYDVEFSQLLTQAQN